MRLTPAADFDVEVVRWERPAEAEGEPDDPGDEGQERDDGHEVAGDDVHDPLDGSPSGLSLAHDLDDMVQPTDIQDIVSVSRSSDGTGKRVGNLHRLTADLVHPHINNPSLIDRAQEDLVPNQLLHQARLAR